MADLRLHILKPSVNNMAARVFVRAAKLDFGPVYHIGESTFLVRAGAPIHTLSDVDKPGNRILGIVDTTTIRAIANMTTPTAPTIIRPRRALAWLRISPALFSRYRSRDVSSVAEGGADG